MKISILEKVRAPSRIAFCEGLVYKPAMTGSFDPQDSGDHQHRNELCGDECRGHADAEPFLQVVADERPTVSHARVVLRTERVFERNERTSEPQELGNDGGRQHDQVDWLIPREGELQRNTPQKYSHPNPVEPERGVGQLAVGIHLAPPFLWFLFGFKFPALFKIKYFYILWGSVLLLIPLLLFLFKYPKLIGKFFIVGVYFFYLNFAYELSALALNWWHFPRTGDFLGWINVGQLFFPFEEFFFYVMLFSIGWLVWYEYFDDDRK